MAFKAAEAKAASKQNIAFWPKSRFTAPASNLKSPVLLLSGQQNPAFWPKSRFTDSNLIATLC